MSQAPNVIGTTEGDSAKSNSQQESRLPRVLLFLAIAVIACGLIYAARSSAARFGGYHDDAIYVTTAKALAEGQGYRIISLPDQPAQTKYPPSYPILLSLAWLIYPDFPQNIQLMVALSIAITLWFLWLTWKYLVVCGYSTAFQALIVVALTGLNWRTTILATGLYSETPYIAISVAGLYLAERNRESRKWVTSVGLGLVLGICALTRTAGIALPVAFGIQCLLRREIRRALLPLGVAAVLVLAWLGWSYLNRTRADGVNVSYYTNYFGYFGIVLRDLQAQMGTSRLGLILSIVKVNLIAGMLVSIPMVALGTVYEAFSGVTAIVLSAAFVLICSGFVRAARKEVRLLHLYVALSLLLYLFWMPGVAYDRFLLPLLPFLLLFLVSECSRLGRAMKEDLFSGEWRRMIKAVPVAIVLLPIAGVAVYGYGSGLRRFVTSKGAVVASESQDAQAMDWIRKNTEPSDTLVCYRDPKYFLYTGRRAVRNFRMPIGQWWDGEPASIAAVSQQLFQIVVENRSRYLVVTESDFEHEGHAEQHRKVFRGVIDQFPGQFVRVYASLDGGSVIYRIENPRVELNSK